MDISDPIYPGAFFSLVRKYDRKRRPFVNAAEVLPGADADLAPYLDRTVQITGDNPTEDARTDLNHKSNKLAAQLEGQSEVLLLHALLIAVLRRKSPPPQAAPLFIRLWAEHGRALAQQTSIRWKISACTTFADHGTSPEQRSLGMGLSILFDCIKMHESERLLSGQPQDTPFAPHATDWRGALAFDMHPYSMKKGDLDRNMLARLWMLAEEEQVMFPLARAMLMQVMGDPRSIFARLQKIKPVKQGEPLPDIFGED